jgi:hypothetical protein
MRLRTVWIHVGWAPSASRSASGRPPASSRYLPLASYTDNLRGLGLDNSDLAGDGNDRLVDRVASRAKQRHGGTDGGTPPGRRLPRLHPGSRPRREGATCRPVATARRPLQARGTQSRPLIHSATVRIILARGFKATGTDRAIRSRSGPSSQSTKTCLSRSQDLFRVVPRESVAYRYGVRPAAGTGHTPRSKLSSLWPVRTDTWPDGSHTEVSASDEHHSSTSGPHWTDKDRRPTRVSAGQAPFDLARPKGFEPLTF